MKRWGIWMTAALVILSACGEIDTSTTNGPTTPPETTVDDGDTTLEALAVACVGGGYAACDELWDLADPGTEFERIGASCGGKVQIGDEVLFGDCVNTFDDSPDGTSTTSSAPTTQGPGPALELDPSNNTWTVILRSVAEDRGIDEALAYAEELRGIDIIASVFLSSDFPSLNPGYWVVYTGEFGDSASAADLCAEFNERGLDCYHRFVGDE